MLEEPSRPSSPRQRSVEDLIETAERLFARDGIAAVSLRQVASAAGHRNPAAVQYHFGSKEGLLRAIIQHRVPAINERRIEMLEALGEGGHPEHLRGIVEAIVLPFVELEPAGAHYVGFLARYRAEDPDMSTTFDSLGRHGEGSRMVNRAFDVALAHLPSPVREHRRLMAVDLILTTLAQREDDGGTSGGLSGAAAIGDLIDATVGLLAAPHTRSSGRAPSAPAAQPRQGKGRWRSET